MKTFILIATSFFIVSCSGSTMKKAENTCENPLSLTKKISCKFKGK